MLHKMRQRAKDEKGFTLIELLVVILIIGILAAIAIPSFLAQKSKANDSSAKELARTAQTTAETIGTDNNGNYTNVTQANLVATEATINTNPGNGNAWLGPVTVTTTAPGVAGNTAANSYVVTATSVPTGNTFSIYKNGDGTTVRNCTVTNIAVKGGCPNATATGSGVATW